ncbi:MAG: zinc ribbon domain-containing protein [Opitutales bacterium]
MPTYEYACELCGHQLEVFQSISAERLVNCPSCSEDGLKRLIGRGGGIIFKGTGFYQTDYKKTTAPASEGCKDGGAKTGAPSSGESTPSKPAAAPASTSSTTSTSKTTS